MRVALVTILSLTTSQLGFAQSYEKEVIDSYNISSLGLTVYPQDLAMVTETRSIDVTAGISEIRFHGVTDMILPETAVLQSFEGLRIEGNFSSDVISKNTLLQKAVGSKINIRRVDNKTGLVKLIEAELISATAGILGVEEAVFKTEQGLEALYCSGLSEAVLFSKIPEGLNSVPMLSMVVNAKEAGPKDITLTYLTRGIGWEADYRMDIPKGGDKASLLGWLTLSNKTSKNFKDANLAVVAGQVNRNMNFAASNSKWVTRRVVHPSCGDNISPGNVFGRSSLGYRTVTEQVVVQEASTELITTADGSTMERAIPAITKTVSVRSATQEELGDYKLYRAPQAVSVKPHQTKQIAFLLKPDVEYEALHTRKVNLAEHINYLTDVRHSRVEYEIDNSADGNLAEPLPKGTLRVMSEDSVGHSLFTGEGKVRNLAVDLPFEVDVAKSFLVTTAFDYKTVETPEGIALELSTDIFNAGSEPITAEVDFEGIPLPAIENSNYPRKEGETLPTFRVPVAPESTETLKLAMSLEQEMLIIHDKRNYRATRGKRKKYSAVYKPEYFKFKHGKSLANDLKKLLTPHHMGKVIFTAVERDRMPVADKKWQIRDEEFTFENTADVTLDVQFLYSQDAGNVELLNSSIEPVSVTKIIWPIKLAPKSKFVLQVKVRAPL